MLILTRRTGESIVIEPDIRITVTSVQGGKVRIGITAPPSVRIDRAEVSARRGEFAVQPAHASPLRKFRAAQANTGTPRRATELAKCS